MTKRKFDQLVRDVANLFVKYSAEDWKPLLHELQNSGPARAQLKDAIEELTRVAETASAARIIRRKSVRKRTAPARPKRTSFGRKVRTLIADREVVPSLGDLRQLAFSLGLKVALPSGRDRATEAVVDHLESLPLDQQQQALKLLTNFAQAGPSDAEGDYQRWFSMILSNQAKS
jgi:MoxR-like ATPase